MIKVKNEFINLYEELSKLNEGAEEDVLATEDDWSKFYDEKVPTDLDYDDMDVSVSADGKSGTLRYYSYNIGWESDPERMDACIAEMLHKPLDEVTKGDLAKITEDELYGFARDYFYGKALAEAERKVAKGDYDYESVTWDQGWGW